jgi:parvulin-like peptidyl-prolyl isomerase
MAKQRKQQEERQVTAKEHLRRRRDVEANRRVTLGLIVVIVLLVGLIGAGVLQQLVINPRQPVATVNGVGISTQDYQKLVRYSWYQSIQQNQPVQDAQSSSLQVLDQAIDDQIVRDEAKKRGITVTQDEVTQAIEHDFGYYSQTPTPAPTWTPLPTPTGTVTPTATPSGPTPTPLPTSTPVSLQAYQTAYQQFVSQANQASGMTEADFRNLVETDLLRNKLYDVIIKDVPTTEEQIKLRHILVAIRTPEPTATPYPTGQPTPTATPQPTPGGPTPTPTPAPRDDAQALARITEVQKKLAAGEDFATLAKEYSDDTGSASSGGELGWIGRNEGLDKTFEDAAFKLKKGEISGPVKTQFGYHIIQVEDIDPKHPIDAYTLQQRQYEAWQTWLNNTRNAYSIQRNWSLDKVPPTPAALTTQGS